MTANENIRLVDSNNIISSDIEIAEKLSNVVKELNVKIKKNVYVMLLLKCKISAIWLVERAYIFLIILIATVQISMEFETQES